MGFIEAVLGKLFDVVEDGAGEFGFDLVGLFAAGYKFFALGGHYFGFLFAHGAAEDVALSEGEAGEGLGGLLNLFLVDDDAVGFVEDGFEQGVVVLYVFGAVFAAGEAFDELHGAGAVEGEDGDDVLYAVGGDLAEGVAHAGGFELEDADGVAAGEELVDFGVVEGQFFGVNFDSVVAFDEGAGFVDDGEVFETEEVHFKEADGFGGVFFELDDGEFFFGFAGERDDVDERFFADDDAGGVHAGVAGKAFEEAGVFHDATGVGLGVGGGFEFGAFGEGLFEGHAGGFGDHFGEAVAVGEFDFENAAEVAHEGFGAEGAEGDDLGYAIFAVFFADVADDVLAAGGAEVDIEVGGGDAVGVEEAFEDEAVGEGVDGGDLEGVGEEGAGAGAAAGADGYAGIAGVLDEVGDDEEVVNVVGFFDDADFVVEAFVDFAFAVVFGLVEVVDLVEGFETFFAEVDKVVEAAGEAVGEGELGEVEVFGFFGEEEFDVAALGDFDGVGDGLGLVGEEGFHFGGAFEVELVAGVAVAAGVGDEVVALEAGENVVGFGVFLVDVVDIVGGDEGEAGFFGQLDEVSIGGFLVAFAVVGEFEVEVVGAENVGVFEGEGFGFFEVAV